MSKTPEELADDYTINVYDCLDDSLSKIKTMRVSKYAFLAGYQAAKESNFPEKPDGSNSSNSSNGWISVKDRLPEAGIEVLFCSPKKEMNCCFVGYRAKENEYVDPEGNGLMPRQIEKYYTHWMPLPKPPEE